MIIPDGAQGWSRTATVVLSWCCASLNTTPELLAGLGKQSPLAGIFSAVVSPAQMWHSVSAGKQFQSPRKGNNAVTEQCCFNANTL